MSKSQHSAVRSDCHPPFAKSTRRMGHSCVIGKETKTEGWATRQNYFCRDSRSNKSTSTAADKSVRSTRAERFAWGI